MDTGAVTADLLIDARQLTRRFGERLAVDNLSFTLQTGSVLALLGPNGAGKTTTMRMLAGLLAPTTGAAVICGHPLGVNDTDNAQIRACCGVAPEAPGFYERLSAIDNLRFFGGLQGLSGKTLADRIDAELQRFGLQTRSQDRVATYSKGMKQRLSLARALLHQPRLLFLDEPTAGLDPAATAELHQLIGSLRAAGCGVVLSTHSLEEAEALADQILVIATQLRYCGRADDLQRSQQHEVQIELLGALPAELVLPDGVRLIGVDAQVASFDLDDPYKQTPALVAALVAAQAQVLRVQPVRRGLRDRYLELLNR